MSENGLCFQTFTTTEREWLVRKLNASTKYYIRVLATNKAGNGAYSESTGIFTNGSKCNIQIGKWNMDKKHLFLTTFKIHTFIRYKHFNGTRIQDRIVNLGFKCAHLFKKSKMCIPNYQPSQGYVLHIKTSPFSCRSNKEGYKDYIKYAYIFIGNSIKTVFVSLSVRLKIH